MDEMMQEPSMDAWLAEAKASEKASQVGMWLTHNGVVRATPKRQVRAVSEEERAQGEALGVVTAVEFSYDAEGLARAVEDAQTWQGISYVKVWLNSGVVPVGGSLMYVLIGADIRPHAVDALQKLVGHIKNEPGCRKRASTYNLKGEAV